MESSLQQKEIKFPEKFTEPTPSLYGHRMLMAWIQIIVDAATATVFLIFGSAVEKGEPCFSDGTGIARKSPIVGGNDTDVAYAF